MRKISTLILALVVCAGSLFAEDAITVGNFSYIFNSSKKTAEVNGTSLTSGKVEIPGSVEYNSVTYTVTSIGKRAFMYGDQFTGFTFPNTLETIGDQAFSGCKELTELDFPASLKSIGSSAFQGDTKALKVTCRAIEPPVCGDYAFATYGSLYVPKGSIEKYADAYGWSGFAPDIYAIDESAIDAVRSQSSSVSRKVVRDGVIYIERNGELFNLTGARVK